MIKFAYDDDAVTRLRVCEWISRFQVGKEWTEDDERSGHPCSSRNEENVQHLQTLVTSGSTL